MSRFAALIWVVIALILGGMVWWTRPRTLAASAAAAVLPDFSASRISEIRMEWPAGERASVSRAPIDSRWILSARGGKASIPPWPLDPARVQGLLRLLAEVREGGDARAMPSAIFLTLVPDSGESIRLAIDPNPLGGTGRIARLDSAGRVVAVGSVDEQFVRAMDFGAVTAWRSTDLLFWAPERTSALELRQGESAIELAKAGGAWVMRTPLATRADAGTIEGVLLLLSKSGVDRFLPRDSAPDDAWKSPWRVIRLATRVPAGAASGEIVHAIEVGPAINSESRTVRMTGTDTSTNSILWGPELAIVNSSTLDAIAASPGDFVSRLSLDLPAADVGSLEIGPPGGTVTLKRSPDGTFASADSIVRELLRALCEVPASQSRILEAAPANKTDALVVRPLGPKGESLGTFHLRAASAPAKVSGAPPVPAIEITRDTIARMVPWQRPADFLAALRALAAK